MEVKFREFIAVIKIVKIFLAHTQLGVNLISHKAVVKFMIIYSKSDFKMRSWSCYGTHAHTKSDFCVD